MALETTLVIETAPPVPYTCADGTGIEKGALLEINDPNTVTTTNGDTDRIVGIAAEEKIANDGKTTIPVFEEGRFIGNCGAAGVSAGLAIITDTATGSANELVTADVNSEYIVGTALETATDGQSFLFKLHPFTMNLA